MQEFLIGLWNHKPVKDWVWVSEFEQKDNSIHVAFSDEVEDAKLFKEYDDAKKADLAIAEYLVNHEGARQINSMIFFRSEFGLMNVTSDEVAEIDKKFVITVSKRYVDNPTMWYVKEFDHDYISITDDIKQAKVVHAVEKRRCYEIASSSRRVKRNDLCVGYQEI